MEYKICYVTVDTETGGLSPEKNPMLEIAMVAMNHELEDIGEYSSLIKPYDSNLVTQPQALQANGISLEQLQDAPDSLTVAKEIADFLKKRKVGSQKPVLCGHNIDKFDIPFISNFLRFHKIKLEDLVNTDMTIDTMWWCRMKWTESPNYKLGTCVQRLGIELVNAHRALADTKANHQMVRHFLKSIRGEEIAKESSNSTPKGFRESFQI